MIRKKRLLLNRRRLFRHYEAPIFICGISLIIFLIKFESIIYLIGHFDTPMLMLLILPTLGLGAFINQYLALRLKVHNTNLTKEENHSAIIKTIETLNWTLNVNSDNFIEAFNPFGDIRT